MTDLKSFLRQEMFIAVQDFESHITCYPPGDFYHKHVDNSRGKSSRFLTVLLYLNLHWQSQDKGVLEIFSPETHEIIAKIQPQAGTLVLFLSERFPYAVR